jgi:Zn-dependent protease
MDGLDIFALRQGLILYIILVASLSIHEWAHARSAEKLGDPTPRADGRVTLNPLVHIDLVGTVIFPLVCIFILPGSFLFGWARPVLIQPGYFKHRARDSMLVAAAGPASNLVIALVATVVGAILFRIEPQTFEIFGLIILLNVVLAVFNMLPIPPLDGSHLLRHSTGMTDEAYLNFSRWGGLILLAIIFIPPLRQVLWSIIKIAQTPFLVLFHLLTS